MLRTHRYFQRITIHWVVAVMLSLFMATANAAALSLKSVKFLPLPDNKVSISLQFNKAVQKNPSSFLVKKTSRLVFDFTKASNGLSAQESDRTVDIGVLNHFQVLQAENRIRLVMQLREVVSYSLDMYGSKVTITLSGGKAAKNSMTRKLFPRTGLARRFAIRGVDFTSSPGHTGRLVISTTNNDITTDVDRSGNRLSINFRDTILPQRFKHRIDVRDFGTPVQMVDSFRQGNRTRFVLKTEGAYEHFVYQVDRKVIIEVRPVEAKRREAVDLGKREYRGKRISLNFQDIKVRAVLQLLAEFTKLNIVVSDTVDGNITLRLNHVPWDQALDIILKTRGLAKRQFGSVLLIAPAAEIAAQEKAELQARREVEDLAPLTSDLVQVNYAKAANIATLIKDKTNSLLSQRGNISVDERTNMLWVQDISSKVQEIRSLVHKLDVPVKQVLIEARVVNVNRDFERDLGIRFGVTNPQHLTGSLEGANALAGGAQASAVPIVDRLNVDLPGRSIADPTLDVPTLGLALAKLGKNVFLDLELSALESEGHGEVVSSPRLITANQQSARIESGKEIPYRESTSSGAASVVFKKAVLSLEVTPQITPDNKIILDLTVNQDSVSQDTVSEGIPIINTKEIQTKVLIENGETIVLGGIYKQNTSHSVRRVPFLGELPFFGYLFRKTTNIDTREELLIFVTPSIIEKAYEGHVGRTYMK